MAAALAKVGNVNQAYISTEKKQRLLTCYFYICILTQVLFFNKFWPDGTIFVFMTDIFLRINNMIQFEMNSTLFT